MLAKVRPKNEDAQSSLNIGIVRRFDFESKLQRMSVVVKDYQDNSFKLHLKGSPEKVQELCKPETIPQEFQEILDNYTVKGYRVIALATKTIDASK